MTEPIYSSNNIYNILMRYVYCGDDIEQSTFLKLIIFDDKGRASKLLTLREGDIDLDAHFLQKLFKTSMVSSFLISRNFLGGDIPKPEEQDYTIILQLKAIAIFMNIPLYDYMIVTKDNYYSFTDNRTL